MSEDQDVLCVGLLCLDIITVCDGYPQEDTDQKCLEMIWQRGGNASNSCTALSLLGETAEYLGVVTDSKEQRFLDEDMVQYGIHADHCVKKAGLQTPTATVLINARNGSRTILGFQRNLPEVTSADFMKISLKENKYKWIHFEGRPNVEEIIRMLQRVQEHNSDPDTALQDRITTSVELEQLDVPGLSELTDKADVVFVGKDYAQSFGYTTMETAVEGLINSCRPGATLICPWGAQGAAAKCASDPLVTSPAYTPEQVVDTLGAGDVFIAACITGLGQGISLEKALTFACRVAGCKCGVRGWNELSCKFKTIMQDTFR